MHIKKKLQGCHFSRLQHTLTHTLIELNNPNNDFNRYYKNNKSNSEKAIELLYKQHSLTPNTMILLVRKSQKNLQKKSRLTTKNSVLLFNIFTNFQVRTIAHTIHMMHSSLLLHFYNTHIKYYFYDPPKKYRKNNTY